MPRVLDRHGADAVLGRFFHRQFHGPRACLQPQSAVAVPSGRDGRLPERADLRVGVDVSGPVVEDVAAQHVRHAMTLVASQVGQDHDFGGPRCVRGSKAHLSEHGLGRRPHPFFPHDHLVCFWYLESFEHWGGEDLSPLGQLMAAGFYAISPPHPTGFGPKCGERLNWHVSTVNEQDGMRDNRAMRNGRVVILAAAVMAAALLAVSCGAESAPLVVSTATQGPAPTSVPPTEPPPTPYR